MRAFAAKLFQQGEPPGPWCLRKLLLASFDSATGLRLQNDFIEYGPEDAEKEYLALDEKWKKPRGSQIAEGHMWPCGYCAITFPAEGFGVNNSDQQAVYDTCVATGSWRKCSACKDAPATNVETSLTDQRMCSVCQKKTAFHGSMLEIP